MALPSKTYIRNCTGDTCSGNSHEKNKGKISPFFSRLIFYILLLAFLGVCLYVIFFAQYLQVNKIVINGNAEIATSDLEAKIEKSQAGKFLGLIPKNNFLLIFPDSLERELSEQFRNIRTVSVQKKFPDSVRVDIEERKGLLVWCVREGDCFLLDEQGVAYNQADFNSPEISQNHLLKIFDKSEKSVALGENVLTGEYVKYAMGIKAALSTLGIEVTEEYTTPSRMAEEIDVKAAQNFELFFSTQYELDSAIATLGVILKKEIPAASREKLAYIDLRTRNKVFYKLNKDQDQQTETQEEAK